MTADDSTGGSAHSILAPTIGSPSRALLAIEELQRDFEDFGLTGSEARVLLALLQAGSANSLQLARVCNVSRTNIYRLLDGLTRRRLVQRVPGDGPARWASPGREQLLDRLQVDQEERLQAMQVEQEERLAALHADHERRVRDLKHRHDQRVRDLGSRVEKTRELLTEVVSKHGPSPLLQVHLIPNARQLKLSYEQLLAGLRSELLVFVRPPYSWSAGTVNPAIIEALARRVEARVLYEAAQLGDPEAEGFRKEIDAYHRAGVEARIVDHLPIKLAVFDRKIALIALMENTSAPYPTFLLVEHEGFASFLAEAFDQRWSAARVYRADGSDPAAEPPAKKPAKRSAKTKPAART
ncbi:MAG TPA: helix-turn-helix domain-containing protein [Acidimicrobiales bacterium]|nr:helix-turn-helix domain-containing protein [Acidimicrobiales bacterium]